MILRDFLILIKLIVKNLHERYCYITCRNARQNKLQNYKPYTGELGYDGLNGTRKIGPSYAKSVVYI